MQLKRDRLNREGGFTLIELISVIIILGILAAVIVPKYLSMTDKAQDGVYKGVLNEGLGQFNIAYAKYALTNSAAPNDIASLSTTDYLGTSAKVDFGDYSIGYAGDNASGVTMTLYKGTSSTASTYSNGSNVVEKFNWPG